jgi:hypothetical protein
MERCPVCRARFRGEPECYRCGSQLGHLLKIESDLETLQRKAVKLIQTHDLSAAQKTLEQARMLKHSHLTDVLLRFLS